MRYTLLELVQRILESMESDEVNTIGDTTESLAVANIVKESYFEIVSEIASKNTADLFHLDAATDSTKPAVLYMPSNAINIKTFKYNIGPSITDTLFREICYLSTEDFLQMLDGLNVSDSWVSTQTVSLNGQDFTFKLRNDESPRWYTSPDDHTLILDSYDSSYEDTLTSIRTYCLGDTVPMFSMTDIFVPNLDPKQFTLLLNKAKATAFVELKQTANDRAQKIERRHTMLAYKSKDSTDDRTALRKHNDKGYGRSCR